MLKIYDRERVSYRLYESRLGTVTLEGGIKNKVVGYGTLNVEGMPRLKIVIHVEGVKANMVSVSQLCDDT